MKTLLNRIKIRANRYSFRFLKIYEIFANSDMLYTCKIWWIWLLLTILISCISANHRRSEDKTLNLKIGFDLIQGKNGEPALRVRDFEDDSEYVSRADNDPSEIDSKTVKPAIRADPFSGNSDDNGKNKRSEESSNEDNQSSDRSDDEDDSDGVERRRSTKGLRLGEYEAEEGSPKFHERYQEGDDNSDTEARYRYKRRAQNYGRPKRKGKKVHSARKQGITWRNDVN